MLQEPYKKRMERLEKIIHPEIKVEEPMYSTRKVEFKYEELPEIKPSWDEKVPKIPKTQVSDLYKTVRF